ncbi:MAG: DIP1984 family protein [Synergistaceae bacterium]|jgi:hypothetical protein|nr:DIP1984 family protein [Synergistaceae bacterium]
MKLAEALIVRGDLQKKIAQLRSRMKKNVKVQEGEIPAEPVKELLPVFDSLMSELESLIKKINRTNGATALGGGTLTDAVVARDCLRGKIDAYRELYDAAAILQARYSRSEVKFIRCIDTVDLQKNIDAVSKQYRELDTQIQAANWTIELAE